VSDWLSFEEMSEEWQVFSLNKCVWEGELKIFWNPEPVPDHPTADQVKDKLGLKIDGTKTSDLIVFEMKKDGSTCFVSLDIQKLGDDVVNSARTEEQDESESISAFRAADEDTILDDYKQRLNDIAQNIFFACESLPKLCEVLKNEKSIYVGDDIIKRIDEFRKEFGDKRLSLKNEINKAKDIKALEEIEQRDKGLNDCIKAIRAIVKEMLNSTPGDDRIELLTKENQNLRNEIEILRKENEQLKKTPPDDSGKDEEIAKLKARVAELEKKLEPKPVIYHPKIEGKSLVFNHQQKGRGNDEFIFVCRIPEEPFKFFYLKKEEVEKMKDQLDLNKPITCKISGFERHISSRTETEITEEYQVRLGEVFYICTGTLSQP